MHLRVGLGKAKPLPGKNFRHLFGYASDGSFKANKIGKLEVYFIKYSLKTVSHLKVYEKSGTY